MGNDLFKLIGQTKEPVSENTGSTTFLVSQERFELPTHGLEGRCSILLSYWDKKMERVMGIEPT